MNKQTEIEFKTLLSEAEYNMLMQHFANNNTNEQTNHYFDTPRFSLKAAEASLRVRERDGNYELTLKRKKGYSQIECNVKISKEEFDDIKTTGYITNDEILGEISSIIGNQKLVNFLSLNTLRMYFPYSNGVLFIDKSNYLGLTDYELEYEAKSYHLGKEEFISIIKEFKLDYKKSDKKINRAFNAYKRVHADD